MASSRRPTARVLRLDTYPRPYHLPVAFVAVACRLFGTFQRANRLVIVTFALDYGTVGPESCKMPWRPENDSSEGVGNRFLSAGSHSCRHRIALGSAGSPRTSRCRLRSRRGVWAR